jgi:hypothetical protein
MLAMTTNSPINVNARKREWVALTHHPLTSVFYFALFLASFTRLHYGARR